MPYDSLASQESIDTTAAALKQNGIDVHIAANGAEAKQKLFELLPAGASVMDMTSETLRTIGAVTEIQESGKYDSIKKKLMSMDRTTQGAQMQQMGAAPDWAVGSVHAVTEDGSVMIASATGSQLSAYAYGANHVVWVVGTQKIVKDKDDGMKRIYEYTFPLENERSKKAYGVGSGVNKMLVVNKEFKEGRITMILVKEKLGF